MQWLSEHEFDSAIGESALPVLVDFWAPWCRPCRLVEGPLADIAEELEGKLRVVKVNVDESPMVARRLGIYSIPTLVLFVGGERIDSVVGPLGKRDLLQWLEAAGLPCTPEREIAASMGCPTRPS